MMPVPPPDRFDWQAAMATADVFAAYFDCLNDAGLVIEGSMFEVLCEHHEDWALVKGTRRRDHLGQAQGDAGWAVTHPEDAAR
jgi:hypothetical protein